MCNIIQWLHAHPKKKSFSSSKIFINYLNKHMCKLNLKNGMIT